MTTTRDQIYSFVNRMASFAMRNPNGLDHRSYQSVKAGSGCYEDLELRSLLNKVEDDRAHREAEKLRAAVSEDAAHRPKWQAAVLEAADLIDPYEMRDGQLVRKSDGRPAIL